MSPSQAITANHPITCLLFMTIATLVCAGIGWLIRRGILPFNTSIAFNNWQLKFIKIWVQVALLVGVILPLLLLLVFWDDPSSRQFLALYLLAVVVQLFSEATFSRWFCASIVVFIGTAYTVFRLWQLWEGMHLTTYPQPWLALLWLISLFWVANLLMLALMAFPSIRFKAEENSINPSLH